MRRPLSADCPTEVVAARLTCDQVAWLRTLDGKGLSGAVRSVVEAARLAAIAQEAGDGGIEAPPVGQREVQGRRRKGRADVRVKGDATQVEGAADDSLGAAARADRGVAGHGGER